MRARSTSKDNSTVVHWRILGVKQKMEWELEYHVYIELMNDNFNKIKKCSFRILNINANTTVELSFGVDLALM